MGIASEKLLLKKKTFMKSIFSEGYQSDKVLSRNGVDIG